ncbi:hypothetical protein [Fowlpox virus]|nr:hypothetical protein [Fowlpox virus]AXY04953.1 hypothetical protein [Fowlpox virus]AXY05212.1 hypothetical protein [Fowlpox virus]
MIIRRNNKALGSVMSDFIKTINEEYDSNIKEIKSEIDIKCNSILKELDEKYRQEIKELCMIVDQLKNQYKIIDNIYSRYITEIRIQLLDLKEENKCLKEELTKLK